jgi:hypothetical protein
VFAAPLVLLFAPAARHHGAGERSLTATVLRTRTPGTAQMLCDASRRRDKTVATVSRLADRPGGRSIFPRHTFCGRGDRWD